MGSETSVIGFSIIISFLIGASTFFSTATATPSIIEPNVVPTSTVSPSFTFIYDENKENHGITEWFNYKGLTWIAE